MQFDRIGRERNLLGRQGVAAAVFAGIAMMTASVAACDGLRDGPKGRVTTITDGDTLGLDNGMVVRLIGMQAPKLGLGRAGFVDWPQAERARQALERLALGQDVRVRYGGERIDRHGRVLGQAFVLGPSEVWIQGQMVEEGMARVYSFADNRACLAELLAAEGRARAMKLGIWSDPYYSVRRADQPKALAAQFGHYELIEGRVLLAESAGGRVYLNFGRYWKEDFTAVIDSAALRLFTKVGMDPLQLGGALVRIRGWLDSQDGPRIEVTHPEQIEVLAQK